MPAIIRVMHSSGSGQLEYKLYSKAEIRESWNSLRGVHKMNIESNAPYVTCKVKDEGEALVLAVLIMRKENMPPSCTHYEKDIKLLLINGEYLNLPYDDLKGHCGLIFQTYSKIDDFSSLRHDLKGEPLFWYPGTNVRKFHENGMDLSAEKTPMGSHRIHIHDIHNNTSPKFAGLI